jgi:hypothetical protein
MVVEAHTRGGELGSALHQSYLDRGFTLVRMDDNPADPSGACSQRPATVERHAGPDGFAGDRQ